MSDLEFDQPVEFLTRTTTTIGNFPHVPEMVEWDENDDYSDQIAPWVPVKGKSNQHGYDGPLFHESEFIGDGLTAWMHRNPAVYCPVVVYDPVTAEPVGWMLLQSEATRPVKSLVPALHYRDARGRVDFDNDVDETVLTINAYRENGETVVYIDTWGADIKLIVDKN